jgi:hypothetical protein
MGFGAARFGELRPDHLRQLRGSGDRFAEG